MRIVWMKCRFGDIFIFMGVEMIGGCLISKSGY